MQVKETCCVGRSLATYIRLHFRDAEQYVVNRAYADRHSRSATCIRVADIESVFFFSSTRSQSAHNAKTMMRNNITGDAIRLPRATVAPNWAAPLAIDSVTADAIGSAEFFQSLERTNAPDPSFRQSN